MVQLVKKQHVLPKKSIERFYDENSQLVHVFRIKEEKCFKAGASNACFVAQRKWDEQIERDAIAIESEFQKLANDIYGGLNDLDDEQLLTANRFYALISQRSIAKDHSFNETDSVLTDICPSEYSQQIIDTSERDGIFLGGHDQIERVVRGVAQRMAFAQTGCTQSSWGVIRSIAGSEFIVSDSYHRLPLIPIDPFTYLRKSAASATLSSTEVDCLNESIFNSASAFIFGRNLHGRI